MLTKKLIAIFFLTPLLLFSQEKYSSVTASTPKHYSSKKTYLFNVKVVKVIDGDTLDIQFVDQTFQSHSLKQKERIRLLEIDTFESGFYKKTRKKIQKQAHLCGISQKKVVNLGKKATIFVQKMLQNHSKITLKTALKRDRYHRLLGKINLEKQDLGTLLLQEGLALPYPAKKCSL